MLSRFFILLLDVIKKRHAKLASIAVETRKATTRDKDHDGDTAADPTLVPGQRRLVNICLCLICCKKTTKSCTLFNRRQVTGRARRSRRSWMTWGMKEMPMLLTQNRKKNRQKR